MLGLLRVNDIYDPASENQALSLGGSAILHNAHVKVKFCFFVKVQVILSNEHKIRSVFEIRQLCFLHFILLFTYLSVLFKPRFIRNDHCSWFCHAGSQFCLLRLIDPLDRLRFGIVVCCDIESIGCMCCDFFLKCMIIIVFFDHSVEDLQV